MADPPSTTSREQLLTLKVMRLTRPTFYKGTGIPYEQGDTFSECLSQGLTKLRAEDNLAFAVNNSLVLPQSFHNIYLGETFSCYVCVHNDSEQCVTGVSLKVDLQTQTQRVSLPGDFQEGNDTLQGDATLGEVISHEVKEVGQHILVCAVTYSTPSGEVMYFRKFFKFPVSKPLDVRTKFYNAECGEVYLEAQIQNTTSAPIVLEKVVLEPSNLYTSDGLNLQDIKGECPGLSYVSPEDTRQFLYRLTPCSDVTGKAYRGVSAIGKLDMVWRSGLGEKGRLQTSQLQRMAPGHGDLRLTVTGLPPSGSVPLNANFSIVCQLTNCSDRALHLDLTFDPSMQPGLQWLSTDRSIGQVEANSSVDVTLDLRALCAGLQTIGGVRLTDTFLKRTYEHDEIAHVFVWS